MSNYAQITFFAPKDALLSGNPLKIIKGADVDPELAAISVAIASKYDASTAGPANPTSLVGLTAVNGAATTWMRSDGAPALDQTISPTWTGNHTFSGQILVGSATGGFQGAGTINATALYVNGTAVSTVNLLGSNNVWTGINAFIASSGSQLLAGTITINANPASGTDPAHLVDLTNNGGTFQSLRISSYAGAGAFANDMHWQRARGTEGSPAAVQSGDFFMSMGYRGWDGTGLTTQSIGAFQCLATENWGASAHGLQFQFGLQPDAGAGAGTRQTIWQLGYGTSNQVVNKLGDGLITGVLSGNTDSQALDLWGGSTTGATGAHILIAGHTQASVPDQVFIQASTITIRDLSSHQFLAAAAATIQIGNNSTNPIIQLFGGTIQGYGPVAAALVDMTPDQGTFTGTLTGFTANPTGTCIWVRHGNQVVLLIPAMAATSNSTSMTLTGLPAAIQPAHTQNVQVPDYSSTNNTAPTQFVTATFTASSGTVTFQISGNTAGFTGTGSKGINSAFAVSYLLN